MRFLKSLLLASSCLLSSVSSADCAAAPDDGGDGDGAATATSSRTREVYTMGFEAETSVFKVRPREGDETYKMKIFSVPENPPHLWVFTSDTLDETIPRSSPPHWMNTECLTIGGLNEKQIQEAAKNVKAFWDFLCKKLTDPTHEFNLTATDISFPVKWSDPSVEYDSVIVQKPDRHVYQQLQLIYSQITYGLPLASVHKLFEYIASYLHEKRHSITSFWFGLTGKNIELENSELPLTQAQAKNTAPATVQTNTETREETLQRLLESAKSRVIARIFRENNNPQLEKDTKKAVIASCAPIIAKEPSPATGLALLTAFYVYSLFSNNLPIITEEPGPKPNVGIMSRISFSEMFQKLHHAEKELYQTLITECLAGFFPNKLVSYTSVGDDRISFQQWYDSIINSPKDLLSPPPGCRDLNPSYAMGAYNDFIAGHALLEVRAYSERAHNSGAQVTIDNFCQFIDNEASWFFSLQQKNGGNNETQ